MMLNAYGKLNRGLSQQNQHSKGNSFRQQIGIKFKEESSKVLPWSIACCGIETSTIVKEDQKYLECFKM